MRTVSKWVLALCAPLMMVSCTTGPYKAKSHAPVLEDTESLVLLDKPLRKMISVEGQRASYAPDGRLVAEAKIRNLTRETLETLVLFRPEAGKPLAG